MRAIEEKTGERGRGREREGEGEGEGGKDDKGEGGGEGGRERVWERETERVHAYVCGCVRAQR